MTSDLRSKMVSRKADRCTRSANVSAEPAVLGWMPDGVGGNMAVHAASGQTRASRLPRTRRTGEWLNETPCITDDGLLLWYDTIRNIKAPTIRVSVDASRRDRKVFAERTDAGLCLRACFLFMALGIEKSLRRRPPVLVLLGRRPFTRKERWDFFFLGTGTLSMADSLAIVLRTSGAQIGLEIDTKDVSVPNNGSASPLLRWDGTSVGLYNRDGLEVDRIREAVRPPNCSPALAARGESRDLGDRQADRGVGKNGYGDGSPWGRAAGIVRALHAASEV